MSQSKYLDPLTKITQKYNEALKENQQLKLELESLKKLLDQSTTNPIPNPTNQPSEKLTKKSSRIFPKPKIIINWDQLPIEFPDSILCVDVIDSDTLAFGCVDSSIILYSISNKQQKSTVLGHKGAVNSIVFDPTIDLFASCAGNGNIYIWSNQDAMFFKSRRSSFSESSHSSITINTTLSHHSKPVMDARWLNQDGHIISGSKDKQICLWDVSHSSSCVHSEVVKSYAMSLDYNKNSNIPIICGLVDNEILLIDHRSQFIQNSISAHQKGKVTQTQFISDNLFASGGTDSVICVWDIRNYDEPVKQISIDRVPTKFDISGNKFIIPCEIGRLRTLELEQELIEIIDGSPFIYTISETKFLNSDNSFVAVSWDGTAAIGKF